MKLVELEIISSGGGRSVQVIEVESGATPTEVVRAVQRMSRMCGWKKVRVGIGGLWSGWVY